MLLEQCDAAPGLDQPGAELATLAAAPRWTVVIPYFNEETYLGDTLESLLAQTVRFRLVLVDNGSTDGTAAFVKRWAAANRHVEVAALTEPRAGQVHALKRGIAAVDTEFVAICDADTIYPPHYLATAQAAFDRRGASLVGMLAHDAPVDMAEAPQRWRKRWIYTHVIPKLLSGQAHAGGYAHSYRTAALRAAGGYDPEIWPYVIKDHELVHRVLKVGRIGYDIDLYCSPSQRRADRRGVRWSLIERVLYHGTPWPLKDWYFYGFLGRRFEARAQTDVVLREQSWLPGPAAVAAE